MIIKKISKENATFQQILAIKENRHKRHTLRKFFVEGVQNIKDAISNNWEIDCLVFTSFNELSNWAKDVVKNNKQDNYEISFELMQKLSDKTDISEIVGIFKMKDMSIYITNKNPIILFLDRPSKKGNLGNIIRSADALNVNQILFTGHSVDIFDHEVISASMGSIFKVPFKYLDSNVELLNLINDLRIKYPTLKVVASSLQADKFLENENLNCPIILLMGNERKGLGSKYYEIADSILKIKMNDNIDSLNLACATSIFLYEINKQRN